MYRPYPTKVMVYPLQRMRFLPSGYPPYAGRLFPCNPARPVTDGGGAFPFHIGIHWHGTRHPGSSDGLRRRSICTFFSLISPYFVFSPDTKEAGSLMSMSAVSVVLGVGAPSSAQRFIVIICLLRQHHMDSALTKQGHATRNTACCVSMFFIKW